MGGVSTKYEVFGTHRNGGAHAMSGGHTLEQARTSFRRMRDSDPDIVRIRVRADHYGVGSGARDHSWLCDWRRPS